MTHRTLPAAWVAVFASLTVSIYAAEPEFETGLVTQSRTYEREQLVRNGGPNGVMPIMVSINRVTVELEGERITGEWKPGRAGRVEGSTARALVLAARRSAAEALATDFPDGTSVQAAMDRDQLLLKRPDGTVVRAKIVGRGSSDEHEDERD
jgi:hypothetical protein